MHSKRERHPIATFSNSVPIPPLSSSLPRRSSKPPKSSELEAAGAQRLPTAPPPSSLCSSPLSLQAEIQARIQRLHRRHRRHGRGLHGGVSGRDLHSTGGSQTRPPPAARGRDLHLAVVVCSTLTGPPRRAPTLWAASLGDAYLRSGSAATQNASSVWVLRWRAISQPKSTMHDAKCLCLSLLETTLTLPFHRAQVSAQAHITRAS
jgi:hypothetical protein